MAEERETREARMNAARNTLDQAICDYLETKGINGMVTSWTMGIGTALFEDGEEYDGFHSVSSANISRWTAIGLLRAALRSAENDGYIRTTYGEDKASDE